MSKAGDPILINKTVVKNRLTMAPTVKFHWADDNGLVHDARVEHYASRAQYGCGLICVEATCVSKTGRLHTTQIGLWEDGQIAGHKKIVDACHKYGTVMLVQLHHAGGTTHPETGPLKSPSVAVLHGRTTEALTISEIEQIEQDFIAAAVRAKKAGYDGVQLHGCHSYLIDQFINPTTNYREDIYGGSMQNRARFGCNIIRGIRKACGDDFIISMRVSGCEPKVADGIASAEEYVAAGCDYLQVSNGVAEVDTENYDPHKPYNPVANLGVLLHDHFKGRIPVSCVNGLLTPKAVNYLLENNLTDTVDLARGLLADPRLCDAILSGTHFVKCFDCKMCQWRSCPDEVKCPAYLSRLKEAKQENETPFWAHV